MGRDFSFLPVENFFNRSRIFLPVENFLAGREFFLVEIMGECPGP